jgi:hypothetical protein
MFGEKPTFSQQEIHFFRASLLQMSRFFIHPKYGQRLTGKKFERSVWQVVVIADQARSRQFQKLLNSSTRLNDLRQWAVTREFLSLVAGPESYENKPWEWLYFGDLLTNKAMRHALAEIGPCAFRIRKASRKLGKDGEIEVICLTEKGPRVTHVIFPIKGKHGEIHGEIRPLRKVA